MNPFQMALAGYGAEDISVRHKINESVSWAMVKHAHRLKLCAPIAVPSFVLLSVVESKGAFLSTGDCLVSCEPHSTSGQTPTNSSQKTKNTCVSGS